MPLSRRHQWVEPEIFSNPSVDQASTRGCVWQLRSRRASSFEHDVGHDARLIGGGHHLREGLAHGCANVAILIELGVELQEVRVELRLRVCRLDDRYPEPMVRSSWSSDSE
jgi:hypothetical protein